MSSAPTFVMICFSSTVYPGNGFASEPVAMMMFLASTSVDRVSLNPDSVRGKQSRRHLELTVTLFFLKR